MENFDIISFLRKAVNMDASDVHLHEGEHPVIRVNGKITMINLPPITSEDFTNILDILTPQNLKEKLNSVFDLDFAYEIEGCSRFRVNLSRQLGKSALVIRTIPYEIKSIRDLHLPESIEQFSNLNNGLILVTGPTGSGKSTTIASLIDAINMNYYKHIITIEDPVEFIYTNKKSIISQRQILVDTPSFPDGIKYALRQDPDVIFVGEIRDDETIKAALKAAETGHLVFATIHTNGAIQTVDRMVTMFDPADREYVRMQIAQVLRGVISQKIIPLKDGSGRIPACEILVVTPTVKDFVEKDKLDEVYDLVKKGSFNNMITMNMSLHRLWENDLITQEAAMNFSDNKNELQQMLRGMFYGAGNV
ncbi:PilT/PilU family type 4a pilus ATPase [bacterium]|nr:PilT/PilU family type 4a pilus ATPase [bacterium]